VDHNAYNTQVYEADPKAAADFLVTNVPIQLAIRHWIEKLCHHDPIRVLELGSGGRPTRWQIMSNSNLNRVWDITMSDFSLAVLPKQSELPQTNHISCTLGIMNLLTSPYPKHIYDVILATYVFDSIWFEEDRYINHTHYPGGLIKRIQEACKTCLAPNGIFISIDHTSEKFTPEYELSGKARFKTENYREAVTVLRSQGYETDLLSLNEFLSLAGQSVPLDLRDHSVLIVYNKNS